MSEQLLHNVVTIHKDGKDAFCLQTPISGKLMFCMHDKEMVEAIARYCNTLIDIEEPRDVNYELNIGGVYEAND